MHTRSNSKILAWILALGILTSGTLALACPVPRKVVYAPARYYAPKPHYRNVVNTAVEARFDRDHNGWIGAREQVAMAHYRVNSKRERYCDFNRNGFVDTGWERGCL